MSIVAVVSVLLSTSSSRIARVARGGGKYANTADRSGNEQIGSLNLTAPVPDPGTPHYSVTSLDSALGIKQKGLEFEFQRVIMRCIAPDAYF